MFVINMKRVSQSPLHGGRIEAGRVCCNPATVACLNAFPVLGEKSKGIVKLGKFVPGREFWS
jgi:hypothetical protein